VLFDSVCRVATAARARLSLCQRMKAPGAAPIIFKKLPTRFHTASHGFTLNAFSSSEFIKRPTSSARRNQEQQRTKHCKIGTRITHHVPEALIGSKQFRNLRRGDCGRNHNQQRYGCRPHPKSKQNKQTARDLDGADKMRREIRVRKSDSSEPYHSHIGIDVLQKTLGRQN
jgi:hypothetical protein